MATLRIVIVAVLDLGSHPICDFDGTIAVLPVDWSALRDRFGVGSLEDLWRIDPSAWDHVAVAEIDAAGAATPVAAVCETLLQVETFAVLTNNDERAVRRYLATLPDLERRCVDIVGRNRLGGSKRDPERFEAGFTACRAALDAVGQPVYVGDADYELELAAALGARVVRIDRRVDRAAP